MNAIRLHRILERNIGLLIFGILFVSAIGGLVQVLPSLFQESLQTPGPNTRPYHPLELVGRDIYLREACNTCHSQQVRPIIAEVKRYGAFSRAGEFVYDRPFLWGSKRTGPDLHRIGGRYSNDWHRIHLLNPRDVVANSIMPAYPWLAKRMLNDYDGIRKKLRILQMLGHPYADAEVEKAGQALQGKTELDALIAYLQVLGTASAKETQ